MFDPTSVSDGPPAKKFQFVAGNLSLDFCNSVGGNRETIPRENLHSYMDLIGWCEQAGLLDQDSAAVLNAKAREGPEEAAAVLHRARELREAIYRIFFAVIEETKPSAGDIALLNSGLARSMGRLRVKPDPKQGGYRWEWSSELMELDYPLGPLAHSAATLLASETGLAHVRQCRADNCGWLFIDSSKNHSRCWCDMRDCGNRAKVRRHRQRHRSTI